MMDERFVLHRYKSTSWAGVVGGVFMGMWFLWDYYANDVQRWDFMIVMTVMALTKLTVLLWNRTRD